MKLPTLYPKGNYWYYSWYVSDDERIQKSCRGIGLTIDIPKEEALARLLRYLGLDTPEIAPGQDMNLFWLRDETMQRLKLEKRRPATVQNYCDAFGHLLACFGGDLLLLDMRKYHVTRFQTYLSDNGHSAVNTNKVCSFLHAAINRLVDDELLEKNPFRKYRKIEPERLKQQHFLEEQLARFLGVVNTCGDEKLIHYLYIALALGLRRTEVLSIRRDDVDLEKGRVRVINIKQPKQGKYWMRIPAAVLSDFAWFLGNREGEMPLYIYKPATVTKYTKALIRAAGLPEDLRLHSLRHTFTTYAIEAGEDVIKVKDHLRHSNLSTTMGYTHTQANDAKEIGIGVDLDALKRVNGSRISAKAKRWKTVGGK